MIGKFYYEQNVTFRRSVTVMLRISGVREEQARNARVRNTSVMGFLV